MTGDAIHSVVDIRLFYLSLWKLGLLEVWRLIFAVIRDKCFEMFRYQFLC